jgi:hypothetical protein
MVILPQEENKGKGARPKRNKTLQQFARTGRASQTSSPDNIGDSIRIRLLRERTQSEPVSSHASQPATTILVQVDVSIDALPADLDQETVSLEIHDAGRQRLLPHEALGGPEGCSPFSLQINLHRRLEE